MRPATDHGEDEGGEEHMFKNILVPMDLSEKSTRALDIAVGLNSDRARRITVLHVIETIEGDDQEDFSGFYERLRVRAEKEMAEIVDRYQGDDWLIDHQIVFGKRVTEIVRFAYEHGMDLIVLGSHQIEPTEDWATISYRVGILSHCPVLMVK